MRTSCQRIKPKKKKGFPVNVSIDFYPLSIAESHVEKDVKGLANWIQLITIIRKKACSVSQS
jgi:hypothetical protein